VILPHFAVRHTSVAEQNMVCSVVTRQGPSVREVEDSSKKKWAIKGIDSGASAAREAERLCKLRGHPLIVPLRQHIYGC